MKKQEALTWLKGLGVKIPQTQARGGWIVCECPLGPWRHETGQSSAEVFGVRLEPGDSFCNCFACDWHGKQSDLIITMRHLNKGKPHGTYLFGELLQLISDAEDGAELDGLNSPDIEEQLFAPQQGLHVYPEWWLKSFPNAFDVGWAMDYLKTGREGCDPVPDEMINLLDIRADTSEKRVCFPVRDFKGGLVGLHGRAISSSKDVPRYKMYLQGGSNNPIVWLGESWVDLDKPLVVVEGPFDLASVRRVYSNVASPLFSNPSEAKLKRMAGASEWVTFLDHGTGGNKGREKMEKTMKDGVVYHAFPPKGTKDPGAMSVPELITALEPFLKLDIA